MAGTAPSPAAPPAAAAPRAPDEATVIARFNRLKKVALLQAWIIAALGGLIFILLPFAHTIDLYFAINPQKAVMRLVALDIPNMTNRAVLSWATTSVTEVMTLGFGDLDRKLPEQKWRFTRKGWDAYAKAFVLGRIGETFRSSQLVLTTVPSNTPVIVAQGVNPQGAYEWIVQMPVIMTYATNNNVTRKQSSVVTLTLVRVPLEQSPDGIAIESWQMGG